MSRHRGRVVIDTYGARAEGVGHVLRALTLAGELRARGLDVALLTRPPALPLVTKAAGALHRRLPRAVPPDVVLVDRPDTTAAHLRGLHARWPQAKLMALDYYGPPVAGLEAVVNLNQARERAGTVRRAGIFVKGLRYATLREAFARLRRQAPRRGGAVRTVFVGFGGTDPHRWTLEAVRALRPVLAPGARVHVVRGRAERRHGRERVDIPGGSVMWHDSVREPARLLARCELAVIGGGTMLIEAACLGVPAVVVPRTRHESVFARQFGHAAVLVARRGSFPSDGVERAVRRLAEDPRRRARMRSAGRRLVDGRGARRVAAIVVRLARSSR